MTTRKRTPYALAALLAAGALAQPLLPVPSDDSLIPAGATTNCGYGLSLYTLRREIRSTSPPIDGVALLPGTSEAPGSPMAPVVAGTVVGQVLHSDTRNWKWNGSRWVDQVPWHQARWGICNGNWRDPRCAGMGSSPWLCAIGEAERSEIDDWYRWKISGSCTAPAATPYPSVELQGDVAKVVYNRSGSVNHAQWVHAEWRAACWSSPAPTPVPTAAPTPTPPPATPAPTATPSLEECPPCPCESPPQPSARVKQTARVAPGWTTSPQRAAWLADLYAWAREVWEWQPACACSTGRDCTVVTP